jgi:muramoyltetrapeptide carboxypeptidase
VSASITASFSSLLSCAIPPKHSLDYRLEHRPSISSIKEAVSGLLFDMIAVMNAFKALAKGDEIRVVASSNSAEDKKRGQYELAQQRLESAGFTVSFGEHVFSTDILGAASAVHRAADMNTAFADSNVKAIIAIHGGYASNEILPLLDWKLIRDNPKPFVGYSDNTVLLNAMYAKAGNIGFLGPNFGTHGYEKLWEYTFDNFVAAMKSEESRQLYKSEKWMSNGDEESIATTDWRVLQAGTAQGRLLGGNGGSFYLLQGTAFMPTFDGDFILLLEEDNQSGAYTAQEFSRHLESILQQPSARDYLKGLIIGRFERGGLVDDEVVRAILESKNVNVPTVSGVDFGHTLPMLSLPIGGTANLEAGNDGVRFSVSIN